MSQSYSKIIENQIFIPNFNISLTRLIISARPLQLMPRVCQNSITQKILQAWQPRRGWV